MAGMTDLFVLVHAPALGPASWQPVADELAAAGRQVAVPSLTGLTDGGPPYAPRLAGQCAAQVAAAGRPVVLVVHSGAGAFAGRLAPALSARSVIFADAGLPAPAGPTPVVDAAFLPYLRGIARDGIVPPWPEWFPEADPAELFPGDAARAAVLADARPLPLAFFEEAVPAAGRPLPGPRYLLFSAGYQPAAAEARRRGWPVAERPGSHLHLLVRPAEVAAAIEGLAAVSS